MKYRNGFVSNSSTCSFVIPLPFISEEQRKQIWDWYSKKSEDTYMDDEGKVIKWEGRFLTGTIGYVQKEFLEFTASIGVPRDNILLMEY